MALSRAQTQQRYRARLADGEMILRVTINGADLDALERAGLIDPCETDPVRIAVAVRAAINGQS